MQGMTAKLYQHLIAFNQALTFLSRLRLPFVPLSITNLPPPNTPCAGPCEADPANQIEIQIENQAPEHSPIQTPTHLGAQPDAQPDAQAEQEASPQSGPQSDLQGMVIFFPLVGMLLAALAVLPLWLGLGSGYPALQALIFLSLTVWLSRGLHWDGLADLLDACASNASGEKFQAILKDHHLGAIGALGLMLALLVNLTALYYLAQQRQWLLLIWSAGAGQLAAFALASFALPSPTASLGKIFAVAKLKLCLCLWLPLLLLSGAILFNWQFSLVALVLVLGAAFYLACLAKKHGGYNGDFLGAVILLGQMAALLAALCFKAS